MSVEKMFEAAQNSNFAEFASAFADHLKTINLDEAKKYSKELDEASKKKVEEEDGDEDKDDDKSEDE